MADLIGGGDADWRQRMEDSGATDAIAVDIRDMVAKALPDGVWITGDEFLITVDPDMGGFGYDADEVNIREIIEGLDFAALVEVHDVDRQTETAPEPYAYDRQTLLDLYTLKNKITAKVEDAEAALAAMPPNSKSYKAGRYRSYIDSAPKRIADLDRLIAIVEASHED